MTYLAREATLQDIEWIQKTASVKMLTEEMQRPELVDYNQIFKLVHKGVTEHTFFVVEKDGDLVGVLGSFLIPNLYNPAFKTLAEVVWYVLPEHRKSRAGYLLLQLFNHTANKIAHEATLSILTSSSEIKVDSLEKRGFKLNEFAFNRRY